MAKSQDTKSNTISGIAFLGCIVTGTGIGMLMNNVGVGSVLGVGIGFILMALLRAVIKD